MSDVPLPLRPEIPCVFISACSRDLKTFRTVLSANLLRLGFHPIVQEDFTLTYLPLKQKLEELIQRCDFVIHLAGHAYGAEPRQQPDGIRRSYTQLEYYFARESGKPVYTFLCADDFPYDRLDSARYPHPEANELLQLQEQHRQFIKGTPENREYARVSSIRQGVQSLAELQPRFRVLCQHLEGILPTVHQLQTETLEAVRAVHTDVLEVKRIVTEILHQQAASRGYTRIWNPPTRAERFFGREQEFIHLLALWDEHPRLAITGMGGLGKTALAGELLDWFGPPSGHEGPFPRRLLLHDFYRQPSHLSALDVLLRQAGHDPRELSQAQMESQLATGLNQPDTYLYLEGCEKAEDLSALLALTGNAKVLLTLRGQTAPHGTSGWKLPPLSIPDAAALIAYLAGVTTPELPPSYQGLAKFLGGHALACRLAGSVLKEGIFTTPELLEELKSAGLSSLDSHQREHESVDWLLRQTALAVAKDQPAALRLWSILALGALSPLPLSLLGQMLAMDKQTMRPLLKTLQDRGILLTATIPPESGPEPESAAQLAHALIQTWTLRDLPSLLAQGPDLDLGETYTAWRDTWHAYLFRCNENRSMIGGYRRLEALLPQFEPLLQRLDEVEPADSNQHATLLNNLAVLYYHSGRLLMAESLMLRALAMDEASYGPHHPKVAIRLNNLAQLLQDMNRLGEVELLMRRALAIDEVSYGEDHPNVARDLNNLASLLQATNQLGEAEPLMRRALAIDEASYGEDHPDVARDLNNLALLLQATSRPGEAEPLLRRALKINETNYGLLHPNVATALNNLGQFLFTTSCLREAEPMMRRALAIDQASYGADHPNVATDLANLATLLLDTNRLGEAEPLMRRVVTIFEKAYGENHPDVASALNNLAHLLQATNRLGEAEPLMRRALQIDESSYGADHPNVARDLNNLAQLLKETNRLEEAEPLMRRHLVIFLKFLASTGHPHPHQEKAIGNYVGLLQEMERTQEEITAKLVEAVEESGLKRKA